METDPGLDPSLVGTAVVKARGRAIVERLPYTLFIDIDDVAMQRTIELCRDEAANMTSPELGWG